jgi:Arc/MetJ family transcription regulator
MVRARMGRTNVVIDDELIERVMEVYDLPTRRQAVDFALRRVLSEAQSPQRRALEELRGIAADPEESERWARYFEQIRGHPIGE